MKAIPKPIHGESKCSWSFFDVRVDDSQLPFVQCDDGVLVIPLNDVNEILLAYEYSPAFQCRMLQLAGGVVAPGDDLEVCANRELQEELGWRAQRLDLLGEIHPFRYLTARQFIFLGRDLVPSKLIGDEVYPVEIRPIRLIDFPQICRRGEIYDATTIAAVYLMQQFLAQEGGLDQ